MPVGAAIAFGVGLVTGRGVITAVGFSFGFALFDLLIGVGILYWRRDESHRHNYPPQRPD
jgi:hypothetical protein